MQDPPTVFLFSYGKLLLESVQIASFGRVLEGNPDSMPGFRRETVEITDPKVLQQSGERFHPMAVPSPGGNDAVAGRVFRISAEELEAADRYEVSDYRRVQVVLKSGITAWAYVRA